MAVNLEELPLPDELPGIPNGWRYESLGDLVEERGVSYGIVQPGSETADGVPIVRVNNIRNGRIDTTAMLKVGAEVEAKFQRSRLRGGEVLLTLVGTLGEVAIVPPNLRGWNVARAVGVIPVRKDPGSLWVSICLRSAFIQHCIRTWATTTVQATFNLRDLAKLPIPVPPTGTREAIAAVLGGLDDKIESNRRMNATLEAMMRALFQSWFVDFDPVRAKLDGRQPTGLDKTTAALFPSSFQHSPLGLIPKYWEVGKLGQYLDIEIGGDWGEDSHFDGAVEVLALRGVDLEHLRERGDAQPPRRWVKESSFAKRRMSSCDVLIAGSGAGPCGRPLWVSPHLETAFSLPLLYSNFCKRFRAKTPEHAIYFDRLLFQMRQSGEIWDYINGTSLPNLDSNGLLTGKLVVVPPFEILKKFSEFIGPIYKQLYSGQSRNLSTLRDTLLPKLLSGELSVAALTRQRD